MQCLATPRALWATQIKTMTWNIEGDISDTVWNSADTQALGRIANYYVPDVLTFSEADCSTSTTSIDNLSNDLMTWAKTYLTNWPNVYVYVSTYSDGYEDDAILSRYPMGSFTDQSVPPRGLAGAVVQIPRSTNGVKIYTCHLKADFNEQ